MIGKLNDLMSTGLKISFIVGLLSQFIHKPERFIGKLL